MSKRSSRRASGRLGRFVQGDLRVAHSTLKTVPASACPVMNPVARIHLPRQKLAAEVRDELTDALDCRECCQTGCAVLITKSLQNTAPAQDARGHSGS